MNKKTFQDARAILSDAVSLLGTTEVLSKEEVDGTMAAFQIIEEIIGAVEGLFSVEGGPTEEEVKAAMDAAAAAAFAAKFKKTL